MIVSIRKEEHRKSGRLQNFKENAAFQHFLRVEVMFKTRETWAKRSNRSLLCNTRSKRQQLFLNKCHKQFGLSLVK